MSVIFDGDAPALICWQCRRYHGYFSKWVSLGMHSLALYRDHGLASWSSQTLSRSYCTFQSMNIGPHWGTAVAYTVQTAEAAVRGWRHRLRALQALTTASACTSTETVHLFSLFATRTYCNPHGVHGEEPKMRPLFFFFCYCCLPIRPVPKLWHGVTVFSLKQNAQEAVFIFGHSFELNFSA